MTRAQGIELARAEFVDRGMIADLNVHFDLAEDGMPKPHAHVMLTMRAVDGNGFGQKVRDWNRTEMVERWRERWAEIANERLAELDIDARIDHRSLEAQGIALEPQSQIGAPAKRIENRGIEGEGSEADRAEIGGEPLVARRHPTTLFDLVEEPLDLVASTIEIGAEADRIPAIAFRRDVSPRALLHDKLPDPVRVIATVGKQH